MNNNQKSEMTKITVKLFAPMYADFDKQLSAALLRRDAFIDRMIAGEITNLRNDLAGKRMSPEANRYVSGVLKKMGGSKAPPLHQTSIALRATTAAALNEAVEAHNLVRDSFINWLIALLRSSDTLLEKLDLPKRIRGNRRDGTEDMPTSPLKAIEETQSDPLYYLRAACEQQYECGLYSLALPPEMHGLSCYIADEDVPGTPANAEKSSRENEQNELMADLWDFEASISPIKSKRNELKEES